MPPQVETRREPVTDTHHGVEVTEDYRWLEGDGDEVRSWTAAQADAARSFLDRVEGRDRIARRFDELLRAEATQHGAVRGAGPATVVLRSQPPRQQPFLVVLDDLDRPGEGRVLLDPNELDPSGRTTIDFFEVSPDGRLVAVSLSAHGTEAGTVHVYRTDDGEEVGEPLHSVNSGVAGGSLAWRADGSGFWCTHHAPLAEVGETAYGFFQTVAFHDVTTGQTAEELGGVFAEDRIAENFLSASPDGRWVMDRVQRGDGNEWEVFVRRQDDGGTWVRVSRLEDGYIDAVLGTGDELYLLGTRDTPRGQVLRMRLPDGEPEVVLPQDDLSVEQVAVTDAELWVARLDGGPSVLHRYTRDGERLADVPLPEVCSVAGLSRLGGDRVVWATETFTEPRSWWTCADGGSPRRTGLDTRTPVDLSGYRVRREVATSADGTRVPVTLLDSPGTPTGAPTLLTGYGGYGISLKPSFVPDRLFWLEQGGVHAIANVRGGGEYGVEWHHGGRLTTKQHCFDDFIACADHLVDSGVTTRDRLAIIGGSNGGLLMGAVTTQRPDLARAVVAMVPVMDAIRSETTPNGEFNTTEFGTVDDPEQFRALLAYSPYHHVVDGTAYPAVLLTAGERDPRVEAWHAKKMAARLQAANGGDEPVLLRMDSGGHGIGQSLDDLVALRTDVYAFLVDRLGLDLR